MVAATRRRLEALSAAARGLLLAASALPEPDLDTLIRLAGGEDEAQAAFDEVIAAGILVVTGERVRFEHPLLAETADTMAPSGNAGGCTSGWRCSPATPRNGQGILRRPVSGRPRPSPRCWTGARRPRATGARPMSQQSWQSAPSS